MKSFGRILFCLLVVAFMGCGGGNGFKEHLVHLDSLLIDYPDSVFHVLEGMHEEALTQKKSTRMYYELMRADAQNKAYIDFTTDSVMKTVADYYDHHGSANHKMRAHYLLGCTYRDLNDVPMELQCFQDAVEQADTISKDCDLYTLYAIYGQMADLYHNQYLPKEELNALAMCEKIAAQDKDTISEISAYELRLRAYFLLNIKDSVICIASNSHDRYLALGDKKRAACLLNPMISSLIDKEEYSKAKIYMREFIENSGYFDNKGNVSLKGAVSLFNIGQLYLHENKNDSAKCCFEHLLDFGEKTFAYNGLLSLYEKKQMSDSIAKYARLYTEANDSSYIGKNSEVIAQMTAMYNYGHHKQIAEKAALENAKIKSSNYILLIIIILLASGGTILAIVVSNKYKEQQRKKVEELELLALRYNATKAQLEKAEEEKRELQVKIESLSSGNETKVKEYEEKADELQKRINTLTNTMMSYKQIDVDIDATAWFQKFKSADIVITFLGHLSSHNHNHNYIASEEEWDALVEHFKNEAKGYYDFIANKDNNLSNLDIRVCILSTLGFRTKDIANILNKSGQHITNTRNRIRTKLFLCPDKSQKLNKELQAKLYTFIKK